VNGSAVTTNIRSWFDRLTTNELSWGSGVPPSFSAACLLEDRCPTVQDSGMIRLTKALNAWGTPEFERALKQEIEKMDTAQLPLQQGLTTGSYALAGHKAMLISTSEDAGVIRVKAGIFYSGIIAGCACADDPTPVNEESEYCVVQLDIDKHTAETTIALLAE
jgi:hypothetical protein